MTIILLKWFNFLFYTDIISYDREEVNAKYFNCLLKSNDLFFFNYMTVVISFYLSLLEDYGCTDKFFIS